MKREYKLFLEDIIKSCEYVQEFVEGIDFDQFMKDEKTSSAVIQKFGIMGEAVKNIPEFIREKYSDIPWKNMAGMRDRIYLDILCGKYISFDIHQRLNGGDYGNCQTICKWAKSSGSLAKSVSV